MLDNWLKVAIPFIAGLQTKATPAVVPPDQLAVLENGIFARQGTVGKRAGYRALPSYTSTSLLDGASRAVFDGNGVLALATERRLYAQVEDVWSDRGRWSPTTFWADEVAHANKNQSAGDCASTNGVTAVVWKYAANSLYFQLLDSENHPLSVVTALATATADHPNALAVGENLLLFYVDTSTNDLKARVIRTADVAGSLATPTVVTVRSDLTADQLYSVAEGPVGAGLVTWESDGSAGVAAGVCVAQIDQFGTSRAPTLVSADATAIVPASAYNSRTDTACTAWAVTAGNVEFRTLNYSTLATLTAETSSTVATSGRVAVCPTEDATSYAAGNHFCLAIETLGASDDLNRVTLVTSGTIATNIVRHAHLASHGWTLAGQSGFMLAHRSRTGLQSAYYMYSHDGYVLGAFEHGTAVASRTPRQLPTMGRRSKCVTFEFRRKLDVDDFKAQYSHDGLRLVRFDDVGRISSARLGNTTYLSGCQLWAFDGQQAVEAGFHMAPDVALGGSGASAGDFTANDINNESLLDGVQYNYRFYYEWYNARGERCRSQFMQRSFTPSFPVNGEGEITISIPTLRHTLKSVTYGRQAEVSIVVYRSAGNDSSVFFRVSSPDPTAAGDNGYIANNFSVDSVSWTDSMPDSQLEDNERDMASVLQLISAPVPGAELLYATASRLYLAGGAIPRGSVLPSKEHAPGDMVEMALENIARPTTDDITELNSINEVIVAFTERQAFALSGPGFDNTGGGAPFASGRVTSDVGCTVAGSSVMVPGGLLFKSAKGIYAMDQSFNVEYLGAPVEAFNALTIKAASVIPDTNQVVFLTSDGVALMFDYQYGQWGTFTQHRGFDACVVGDDYAYLRNDGTVYVRTPGQYTDAGSPVKLRIRTGRFRGDELQGQLLLRRIGILGEYKSPHSLVVRLYYDRNEYWSSERTIDVTSILNGATWGSSSTWGSDPFWGGYGGDTDYRFIVRPARTKCSQIAFEFEDVITDQAGASFELTELLIEVQPMDTGIQNTSAARMF